MLYELFDYQREAAVGVLKWLGRGRQDWADYNSLSAFALSATTGAGKTVIATAVIEALIHGSADLEVDPDPTASFLWVTDDPALNRQTRNKMLAGSDVLAPSELIVLDNSFLEPDLSPGRVYFLNIQQLSKASGFANTSNLRQISGWDVIANTTRSATTNLYLVLDEAHRGMRQSSDRPSIVRRIIGGQDGSNPPVPTVWGISATIDRFTKAMEEHTDVRTSYPPVMVDIEKVRDSGIVKEQIELDQPAESGTFSTTLLRAAVDATLDFEARWKAYAEAEDEPEVLPVLVVQVRDKPSDGDLAEIVSVISQDWEGLGPKAIVNVFGEHDDLVIGGRTIRYVSPESIQDDVTVRVVLAKEAISTGWDCPRAEVLYSERKAKDATHIAQVIGRMVRSPLARRITTDDALNSVACFLPEFNRGALTDVIDELTQPGEPGTATDVVVGAQLFDRNPKLSKKVFELVEGLPSWPKPDRLASPLRRARSLAKLLTDTAEGNALLPNAGESLAKALNSKFDGLMAEHADAVMAGVHDLETYEGTTTVIGSTSGEVLEKKKRRFATADRDLDRDTRRIVGSVKEGAGRTYVGYLVNKANADVDVLDIRTRVAALIRVDGVVAAIEQAATDWAVEQMSKFAVDIKNTTGAAKASFIRVKEQSSQQEETEVELPGTLLAPTLTSNNHDAKELPLLEGHLFSDADGFFPVKLTSSWETEVILAELARPSFRAWYRNPSRASASAHRIGYLTDNDQWSSLQVDFLVVSQQTNRKLGASIIDPHGDYLADARAKLHGLARFAERFGDRFVRIESISRTQDGLRVLDLTEENVRDAIIAFDGGKVTALYESEVARHFE